MNEADQADVAYEDGPKEVRAKKGMPNSQFPGKKMPQENVMQPKHHKEPKRAVTKSIRHGEHR